jgi:hypothetical protein
MHAVSPAFADSLHIVSFLAAESRLEQHRT